MVASLSVVLIHSLIVLLIAISYQPVSVQVPPTQIQSGEEFPNDFISVFDLIVIVFHVKLS